MRSGQLLAGVNQKAVASAISSSANGNTNTAAPEPAGPTEMTERVEAQEAKSELKLETPNSCALQCPVQTV
jgi:hypothetical protein